MASQIYIPPIVDRYQKEWDSCEAILQSLANAIELGDYDQISNLEYMLEKWIEHEFEILSGQRIPNPSRERIR